MPKLPPPPRAAPRPPPGARAAIAPAAEPAGAVAPRIAAWLSPRRLWRAVFVDQLRLRRAGPRLVIALESDAPLPPAAAPALHEARAGSPATCMRRDLGRLLDGSADSRTVLKHVAALEQRLAQDDDAAFVHALSTSTLQHMLRQLHGLIAPPASAGVTLLMSELLQALEGRLHADANEPLQAVSSFFVDHKLEVTELDASAAALLPQAAPEAPIAIAMSLQMALAPPDSPPDALPDAPAKAPPPLTQAD